MNGAMIGMMNSNIEILLTKTLTVLQTDYIRYCGEAAIATKTNVR